MLTESFIASTLPSAGKPPPSAALRDVGICIHEFQPAPNLRSTFKKSSTAPNCLAVSPSHVFAAQSEKAIVHVYSREKGNQEATVPFPERIRSIAIAGSKNGDILVLGTEDSTGGGRLILWETCTGRQVASTASHLKPVTSLVVDPTSNYILSGSSDGSILVWSLVDLLSFTKPPSGRDRQPSNGPLRTFSHHRAAITALAVGHSTGRYNIAVSTAQDSTAIAWDYRTGRVLRTFLLPASAISVALDPVDRAFYVGYDDGSVQSIDFYKSSQQPTQHPLHDASLQSTPAQLPAESQWTPPSPDCGAARALTLSHDGMTLLSAHHNGKVLAWNVGRRKYASTVADYTHPVTNLAMLPLDGLPRGPAGSAPQRIAHTIVKPRYDSSLSERNSTADRAPADYTFSTHILASSLPAQTAPPRPDPFAAAFTHPFFPESMLEEGLSELSAFSTTGGAAAQPTGTISDEDAAAKDAQIAALETELATLRKKVSASDAARHTTTDEVTRLRTDLVHLHDYINELHQKQEQTQRDRVARQARREARETRRREAWFAAEKKGKKGDAVLRQMDAEEGALTSDSDDLSSGE